VSSEAQVALIVGIIAAVSGLAGALGGAALGWFLTATSERRGEKRAAFVELLTALDGCQHACQRLAWAIAADDDEAKVKALDAAVASIHRVDSAVSVAALTVGAEHMATLRLATTASIAELDNAKGGVLSRSVIPDGAWNPILALAKKELGH
jgi:hypothetical protein